jgi:hypothetical protein
MFDRVVFSCYTLTGISVIDLTPVGDLPDEAMVPVYKEMTPYQRLEISFALWSFARSIVKAGLAALHPDWSDQAIEDAAAKRMLNGAE